MKPVPTLNVAGWVNSPNEKVDSLLAHFFESLKSQTAIYGDNVTSLQYLVEHYGNKPSELSTRMQAALEAYLGRYFQSAVVDITHDDNAANITSSVALTISASVMENGARYSIGKLLEISNSKISKITALNNYG